MISLVGEGIKSIKNKISKRQQQIQHLDVSSNLLRNGIQFNPFINLVTLVIDDNQFHSLHQFPILLQLQTFSANKNDFSDLTAFIQDTLHKFVNLKNLSLLKNPLNPFFQGQIKYNIYRDQILFKLSSLKSLDGCAIKIMKKKLNEKQKQQKYQKLQGVAIYDQKYSIQQVKSVKGRSQGNRFLKNNQL